jgi:hypothetical protein
LKRPRGSSRDFETNSTETSTITLSTKTTDSVRFSIPGEVRGTMVSEPGMFSLYLAQSNASGSLVVIGRDNVEELASMLNEALELL